MATRQDTLWQQFLKPVFSFLIDENSLKELSRSINWEQECDRLKNSELTYPPYYQTQNFHGIENGYLTSGAAVTYDAVTQYVLPPNENWIRQSVVDAIVGFPAKIIDLGCGTGSTTLLLREAFLEAEIIGLDLSPYMLAIAEYKARQLNYNIQWLHGLAEATNLPDNSFDLVTASLLFHETPPHITQAILNECYRLLVPGGQVIILDGNQKTLRQIPWLSNIFEEPYIQEYAEGNLDAWLGAAGLTSIRTEEVWWTNQVSYGLKPLPVDKSDRVFTEDLQWAVSG
jgi:ubiquinone/menaquinone biosynthesis C-methylase UbiE